MLFINLLKGFLPLWVSGLIFFMFDDATGIAFCKAVLLCKSVNTITIVLLSFLFYCCGMTLTVGMLTCE